MKASRQSQLQEVSYKRPADALSGSDRPVTSEREGAPQKSREGSEVVVPYSRPSGTPTGPEATRSMRVRR